MTKELSKENTDLMFDPSNLTKETIKNYLCKEATDQELTLGLQIAKTCGLNPIKREVYFIKYGNNPMMVVTGYEVYLKRAEASGQYDGMELTSDGNIKDGSLKACIKVYRKDWTRPLVHEVYYSEYVQNKADGTPNKFWKEKPVTMIKKVAVSQGFRMAFPEQLQGLPYTADEAVDQEHIVDVKIETTSKKESKAIPESHSEAEVVKPKQTPPPPVHKNEPIPQVGSLTCRGTIEDKKIKPFVSNGKAGNKYGVKIEGKWFGTFDSKLYAEIEAWQTQGALLDVKFIESLSEKDGKTYLNLVSIKPVVSNDQGGIDGDDVSI